MVIVTGPHHIPFLIPLQSSLICYLVNISPFSTIKPFTKCAKFRNNVRIEESIRICRNFIEAFVQQGIPVRIISNGVDKVTKQEIFIREGAGLSHIDACLKELAKMDIYASSRNMAEVIREQKEAEGEVSLLISAEQNVELAQAYLDYVGEKGSANWLIPIHRATKEYLTEHVSTETLRGNNGNCIHAEYLVMEELGQ